MRMPIANLDVTMRVVEWPCKPADMANQKHPSFPSHVELLEIAKGVSVDAGIDDDGNTKQRALYDTLEVENL
tara:strand:- start:171 stop:386 length:216 start_codon:yes stop_codon:yes gene_type:complete